MLDGGPCAGGYSTHHAPANLKAVLGPAKRGRRKPDVLDAPEDVAADDEEIFLYERLSAHPEGILCSRGAGCGYWVSYRFVRPLRGQCALFAPDGALTPAS